MRAISALMSTAATLLALSCAAATAPQTRVPPPMPMLRPGGAMTQGARPLVIGPDNYTGKPRVIYGKVAIMARPATDVSSKNC